MKYTHTNPTKTQVTFEITLDAADLADVKKLSIAKLSKKLKVSGFRPGKVPIAVAEKHLQPMDLLNQVAEDAASKFVIEAFQKEDVYPLERPQVDIKDYKPEESLVITAEAQILPKIKLGEYKKLKAKQVEPKIEAKDIDEVVERIRTGEADKVDVTRAAKNGDEVVIDFEGVDEKKQPVAGATGKEYPLTLGSNSFIPGFEEGIVGHKVDETFDLPLTFPKDYHAKNLAGAKVTFKTTITAIKEIQVPKLDDAFAAKTGPFKTVKEMKDDIKRELVVRKTEEAHETYKDALITELTEKSDIPTPEILIKDQLESLERDAVQNLLYQGQTLDSYLENSKLTKEEWQKKELQPTAEKRVRVGLVLAELSKLEKVEVSDGEMNARLKSLMQQYKDAETRKQLDTPEVRRDIANRILTEKTLNRLVELQAK